jgi:hypothetical protein
MFTLLLDQLRHETRPACLAARADARAVIPVKVLVEWNVVAPIWIVLEGLVHTEDSPAPVRIAQEDVDHAMGNFIYNLVQGDLIPRLTWPSFVSFKRWSSCVVLLIIVPQIRRLAA